VVVVGHSLAGHTIPLVADRRPVGRLVFLSALIAEPGRSFVEQSESEPDMIPPEYQSGMSEVDEQGRRRWVNDEVAREILYADCDEADARAAFERLRPQALSPYSEPCPLEALPPVKCTYVVASNDRMVNPAWSRRAATQRLGVAPVEIPSSHSPFLSRPADVARLLDQAV
jgi:pimeloyl-ACP methyl ester carboxylesterase